MNEPGVLIVSTIADVATDHVVKILASRSIPHQRLNTEDLPFSRTMAIGLGMGHRNTLELPGYQLAAHTSVWYRRIRSPSKPSAMQEGIYDFCLQENRATLVGALLSIEGRWMSHPASVWQAEFKPYQLAIAERLGLKIPRSVITNNKDTIRRAYVEFGAMVAKPARSGHVVIDNESHAIYTSRLLEEDLEQLEGTQLSPAIYQELIPKKFDIRVTVVGERIFAAAIDSQSDPAAAVDWRRTVDADLPHHRITLPDELVKGIRSLMRSLGLTFGALDFIQRDDGSFVFLEVNPNGQWLWLDDKLELGISAAVADWLAEASW